MFQLFIANKNYSSWSLRPWLLLQQLDLPFTERLIPFGDETSWQPFRRVNAAGKVPCLVDDTVVVWDSLAIVEYLAEHHPEVWPKDKVARAWARSAASEMHSSFTTLRSVCSMNCGVRITLRETSKELLKDVARIDELWADGLHRFGGPFLAGEKFTAVDAFFAPVAFRVQTYGLQMSEGSLAYAERLRALEPMQHWYGAALKETWREPGHEPKNVGEVTEDYRAK